MGLRRWLGNKPYGRKPLPEQSISLTRAHDLLNLLPENAEVSINYEGNYGTPNVKNRSSTARESLQALGTYLPSGEIIGRIQEYCGSKDRRWYLVLTQKGQGKQHRTLTIDFIIGLGDPLVEKISKIHFEEPQPS